MEQPGGNTSDERNADTGNSAGQETAGSKGSSSRSPFRGFWLGVVIFAGASILVGWIRWHTLPSDGRYIWPVSQADWTAWGTWAGALGAIAAVAFASLSIKQAIAAQQGAERKWAADRTHDRAEREAERQLVRDERAQLKQESDQIARAAKKAIDQAAKAQRATKRELKADRRHDRAEREKERKLVREEREALKHELDQIALQKAAQLTFWYSWSPPSDSDYEEVEAQTRAAEEKERLENGGFLSGEYGPDDQEQDHVFVLVRNSSEDATFEELTLQLAEDDLEVTRVDLCEREAPPTRRSAAKLPGKPPEWTSRTDLPVALREGKQWTFGLIRPSRDFLLKLTFATPQRTNKWEMGYLWRTEAPNHDLRHLILGYRDQEKRHWIRSTLSAKDVPFRLLELDKNPLIMRNLTASRTEL